MRNLLKWNSLDFLHHFGWVIIIAAIVLAVAAVVPNGISPILTMLVELNMMLGGLFFLAAIALAMYQLFGWLRHSSALLELSVPAPAWKVLLSRVIMSVVINTLACLGILGLMLLFGKFTAGKVEPVTAGHMGTIAGLVLLLSMVDLTVLFSYLSARSIGLFRLQAAFITGLLASILMIIIVVFCGYVMLWAHVLTLPEISGQNVITVDGPLQITSFIPAMITCLWICLLEYLGSCLLLKYRVQAE